MRRAEQVGFVALGVGILVLLTTGVGYALDHTTHDGRVARNVTLAGRPIGGLRPDELRARVETAAVAYPATPVRVQDGRLMFDTTADALGLAVDVARTTDAALRVGRSGSAPARLWGWLSSFVRPRRAPLRFTVDEARARATIARLDPGPNEPPVEPTIVLKGDRFTAVPGKPGRGIDPAAVVASLPRAAAGGGRPTVTVTRGRVQPRFSVEQARELATQAGAVTRSGLPVEAGGVTATVPTPTLRRWLTTRPGTTGLELAIDAGRAHTDLARLLAKAGTPAVDAGFVVTGGGIAVTPSRSGTACCDMAVAGDRVLRALLHRPSTPVSLPLEVEKPARTEAEARGLGVKEVVATFTTRHPCCAARVHNIHLMADAVRGAVIEPGKVFSINETVGQRTAAKGYVSAPVIYNGKEDEDVGGGVSQFATTMFNAAFFAGLDYSEYQSHTLYISRYPYGREATMGYPHPDLKVRNTTPYGVLVWPTYTDTSLTVTLYSTKYLASVVQSNQTKGARGSCTTVTTERTRTYLDGRVKVDTVRATYQVAEGVLCDQPAPTSTPAATTTTTAGGQHAPTSSTSAPRRPPPSTPPTTRR